MAEACPSAARAAAVMYEHNRLLGGGDVVAGLKLFLKTKALAEKELDEETVQHNKRNQR